MTRQLERAKIIPYKPAGKAIDVMFNPSDYRISKATQFAEITPPGLGAPLLQYSHGGAQTLSVKLFFDTYDPRFLTPKYSKDQDVSTITRQVTNLMKINPELHAPPICQFSWGPFNFRCVVQQADVQYTLFLPSGVPVRATMDVTFKQFYDGSEETGQLQSANYTKHHVVQAGETLAGIAGERYEDPSKWREIARENNIDDPLDLSPGQLLVIPAIESLPKNGGRR